MLDGGQGNYLGSGEHAINEGSTLVRLRGEGGEGQAGRPGKPGRVAGGGPDGEVKGRCLDWCHRGGW
jgi:hypothetical protein